MISWFLVAVAISGAKPMVGLGSTNDGTVSP